MEDITVLFVDDEVNVLSSLKRGLYKEDYRCMFAESAGEALKIMEEHKIAVIVTDMKMPGMDGLALLRILKEKYPNTVRVVLSGYTHLQQVVLAINQGDIYRYITKPWKVEDEFKPVIRQAVEYYQLLAGKEELQKALEFKNASIQNILNVMNEKLSISRKDYDNVKKFIGGIMAFLMSEMINPAQTNTDTAAFFDMVQRFCQGFLNTIPTEISEFKAAVLLEGITASVSRYTIFEKVYIKNEDHNNIICCGNYKLTLYTVIYILNYISTQNTAGELNMGIITKNELKYIDTEIYADIRTVYKSDYTMQNNLMLVEKLINTTLKELGVIVRIRNQNNVIQLKYKTMFVPKSV